jgi:hypothetical protein
MMRGCKALSEGYIAQHERENTSLCHGWLVQPCGTASKLAVAHVKSATLQFLATLPHPLLI